MVKDLTANAGRCKRRGSIWVGDTLEEGMATHSSIFAWRVPWSEEPGSHNPWGHGVTKSQT